MIYFKVHKSVFECSTSDTNANKRGVWRHVDIAPTLCMFNQWKNTVDVPIPGDDLVLT